MFNILHVQNNNGKNVKVKNTVASNSQEKTSKYLRKRQDLEFQERSRKIFFKF